jgi:hypothetical protein
LRLVLPLAFAGGECGKRKRFYRLKGDEFGLRHVERDIQAGRLYRYFRIGGSRDSQFGGEVISASRVNHRTPEVTRLITHLPSPLRQSRHRE